MPTSHGDISREFQIVTTNKENAHCTRRINSSRLRMWRNWFCLANPSRTLWLKSFTLRDLGRLPPVRTRCVRMLIITHSAQINEYPASDYHLLGLIQWIILCRGVAHYRCWNGSSLEFDSLISRAIRIPKVVPGPNKNLFLSHLWADYSSTPSSEWFTTSNQPPTWRIGRLVRRASNHWSSRDEWIFSLRQDILCSSLELGSNQSIRPCHHAMPFWNSAAFQIIQLTDIASWMTSHRRRKSQLRMQKSRTFIPIAMGMRVIMSH